MDAYSSYVRSRFELDSVMFACSANQIYKLSWGPYAEQSAVPQEVQQAFAARATDDKYDTLKKMLDGMLSAEAGDRWTLSQVAVSLCNIISSLPQTQRLTNTFRVVCRKSWIFDSRCRSTPGCCKHIPTLSPAPANRRWRSAT